MTTNLSVLDARTVDAQAKSFLGSEREAQAEFLIRLAEIDRRKLYLELGFPSLWSYCLDELHLDEGQANLRTRAVHLIRDFAGVADALRTGRASLSTLVLLGRVMTHDNATELLDRAAYKTKTEVEHIVVSIRPIEVKQEGFRAITAASPPAPMPVATDEPAPIPAPAPMPPRAIQPVADDRVLFRALLRRGTAGKLDRAAALASHRIKAGDWDGLIDAMADVFCAHEEKRIAAQTQNARKAVRGATSRRPPAHVRREVWERDGGRCTFVAPDGRSCDSQWRIQYHHIIPAAQGGPATVDNIALRCANHNQYEADLVYGRTFMDDKRYPTTPGRGGDQ